MSYPDLKQPRLSQLQPLINILNKSDHWFDVVIKPTLNGYEVSIKKDKLYCYDSNLGMLWASKLFVTDDLSTAVKDTFNIIINIH